MKTSRLAPALDIANLALVIGLAKKAGQHAAIRSVPLIASTVLIYGLAADPASTLVFTLGLVAAGLGLITLSSLCVA